MFIETSLAVQWLRLHNSALVGELRSSHMPCGTAKKKIYMLKKSIKNKLGRQTMRRGKNEKMLTHMKQDCCSLKYKRL